MHFDVLVVGSGPGGYVAAIRCAQLGMKTAIVERYSSLGGTCLNVGCIPSKALLQSSEYFYQATHHFHEHGIVLEPPKVDLKKMMERKENIVHELTSGLQLLMKKNKITVFQGWGSLLSPTEILVKGEKEETKIQATSTILATGSVPVELPHVKFDGEYIVSSTEALEFPEVPEKLLVIGGGAIGLEMGSVWSRLGSEVTVVELFPTITPFADKHATQALSRALKKQGFNFLLEHKLTGAEVKDGKVHATVENKKGESVSVVADRMLVSVGRKAFSGGLGLDAVGLQADRGGKVAVNNRFQTAVPNIYAIGDLIDGPMLAHKAEEEGSVCAEIIAGEATHAHVPVIPNVVYTSPEMAMAGITEQEAKEKGIKVKTGRFPFRSNGRAKTIGETDGLVKFVADAETDRILGVHIVGPHASELIAELVVAMEFKASSEDIARSTHPHPTLSEVVREAALAVENRVING